MYPFWVDKYNSCKLRNVLLKPKFLHFLTSLLRLIWSNECRKFLAKQSNHCDYFLLRFRCQKNLVLLPKLNYFLDLSFCCASYWGYLSICDYGLQFEKGCFASNSRYSCCLSCFCCHSSLLSLCSPHFWNISCTVHRSVAFGPSMRSNFSYHKSRMLSRNIFSISSSSEYFDWSFLTLIWFS